MNRLNRICIVMSFAVLAATCGCRTGQVVPTDGQLQVQNGQMRSEKSHPVRLASFETSDPGVPIEYGNCAVPQCAADGGGIHLHFFGGGGHLGNPDPQPPHMSKVISMDPTELKVFRGVLTKVYKPATLRVSWQDPNTGGTQETFHRCMVPYFYALPVKDKMCAVTLDAAGQLYKYDNKDVKQNSEPIEKTPPQTDGDILAKVLECVPPIAPPKTGMAWIGQEVVPDDTESPSMSKHDLKLQQKLGHRWSRGCQPDCIYDEVIVPDNGNGTKGGNHGDGGIPHPPGSEGGTPMPPGSNGGTPMPPGSEGGTPRGPMIPGNGTPSPSVPQGATPAPPNDIRLIWPAEPIAPAAYMAPPAGILPSMPPSGNAMSPMSQTGRTASPVVISTNWQTGWLPPATQIAPPTRLPPPTGLR